MLIWADNMDDLNKWLEDVLSGRKETKSNIVISNVEG